MPRTLGANARGFAARLLRLEESADLQDHQMTAVQGWSGVMPFGPAPQRDLVAGSDGRSPGDREGSKVELGLGQVGKAKGDRGRLVAHVARVVPELADDRVLIALHVDEA